MLLKSVCALLQRPVEEQKHAHMRARKGYEREPQSRNGGDVGGECVRSRRQGISKKSKPIEILRWRISTPERKKKDDAMPQNQTAENVKPKKLEKEKPYAQGEGHAQGKAENAELEKAQGGCA